MGFILAAAGSAIGLGNIWRFPYVAGENGGAVFVFIYIMFVLLIGLPVMIAELAIGRRTEKNPVGAIKYLFPQSWWRIVGGLGVITGICILSFYSVIAGWTMQYAFKSITQPNYIYYSEDQGKQLWENCLAKPESQIEILAENNMIADTEQDKLSQAELELRFAGFINSDKFVSYQEKKISQLHTQQIFSNFTQNSWQPTIYLFIFILITAVVVMGGVSAGIERWSKILMPILLALLVILALRSITLKGAEAGLSFYLKPDFTKLTFATFARALGQALFSLSLGMGTMITYGSYISKRDNLFTSASYVAVFDTMVAVLAGLVMFPALFAMGMNPAGGPGLVFIVLPSIFAKMPGGIVFGAGIFILLSVAALTSTISLLEVPVAYFVDEHRWKRKKAVVFMALIAFVVGVPSAMSLGANRFFTTFVSENFGFLDMMNALFGNYSLSIGALFIAVFAGYKWGVRAVSREIEREGNVFYLKKVWMFLIRFICPAAIFFILAYIAWTGNYF